MELFLLYLFTRLDALCGIAIIGIIMCTIAFVITCCALETTYDPESAKSLRRWRNNFVRTVIGLTIVLVFVPTQKDAAIILGGYAVLEVAKTEPAKRLASKSVQLIEQTLDSYLKQEKEKK